MVGTIINEMEYREYDGLDVDVEIPVYQQYLPMIESDYYGERKQMEKEFKVCPLCEEALNWESLRVLLPIRPEFNPNDTTK